MKRFSLVKLSLGFVFASRLIAGRASADTSAPIANNGDSPVARVSQGRPR